MMENTVITDDGKAARLAKYREHLNKMAILLGDKYNLPLLSGAVKQVAWAQDIRTKFAENFRPAEKSVCGNCVFPHPRKRDTLF